MNYRVVAFVFFIGCASLAFFTNCSKVEFATPDTPNTASSAPPTVSEALTNCANAASTGKLQSVTKQIVFEDPKIETGRSVVCEFGKGDNLDMAQNVLTARYEQSAALLLPANAVLCNAELSSTSNSFTYDDMFYLTLNNYVVASSLKKSLPALHSEILQTKLGSEPVYQFDWLKVRLTNFDQVTENSDNYCLGQSSGVASCQWPNSQASGPLSIRFDPALIVGIGLKATSQTQILKFIVTGDNDPATDCTHERLNIDVKYSYYVQP